MKSIKVTLSGLQVGSWVEFTIQGLFPTIPLGAAEIALGLKDHLFAPKP